jgi:hypothetical protein
MSHKLILKYGKLFLHSFVFLLISVCCLELASYGFLRSGVIKLLNTEKKILNKTFPIHIRGSSRDFSFLFPNLLLSDKNLHFCTFDFDPVLGFIDLSMPEFYYANQINPMKPLKNMFFDPLEKGTGLDPTSISIFSQYWNTLPKDERFLILAFGGSTTRRHNWPIFLSYVVQMKLPYKKIVVLNAGHDGFSSFNEKIFFTHWILPVLEANKIRPNLVISLDGVNDIGFGMAGYMYSKKTNAPYWYKNYHGYHQRLTDEVKKIHNGRLGFFLDQHTKFFVGRIITRIFPYTLKNFILSAQQPILQKSTAFRAKSD